MSWASYYWIAAPFLTALICTITWGVRGAIVMFAAGFVLPVAYTWLMIPNVGSPLVAIGFSAFEIAYWWMGTYVAAAIGLAVRPYLRDDDRGQGKNGPEAS